MEESHCRMEEGRLEKRKEGRKKEGIDDVM